MADKPPADASEAEVPLGSSNRRNREFRELDAALPAAIREAARRKFILFVANPRQPSLRLHKLKPHGPGNRMVERFSVTVTPRYRALFFIDGPVNVWYWIGTHADYDRFTAA